MVCFLFASSTDTSESQPTSVSGNGVTYTQHATTFFQSGVTSGSVWAGIVGASPTADVVTASGWATNRTGISIAVFEITGADVSGTALNALQTVNTAGPASATSGSVTMSGPVAAGNLCCGMFDHTAGEVIAAGTGNALGSTGTYGSPNRGAGSVYNNAGYADPAGTWSTNAGWRGFGVEIKAAAAGITLSPTVSTATADGIVPVIAYSASVAAVVATATAGTVAPTLRVNLAPTISSATAAAIVPGVRASVAPTVASASAAGIVPVVSVAMVTTIATGTASGVTPTINSGGSTITVTAVIATATAAAIVPALRVALAPSVALATAAGIPPALAVRLAPAIAAGTAAGIPPAVAVALAPLVAAASAAAIVPIPSLRLAPTTAAATARALVPSVVVGVIVVVTGQFMVSPRGEVTTSGATNKVTSNPHPTV